MSDDRGPGPSYAVRMPVRNWHFINGTIDNEVNIEVVDGDQAIAQLGMTIMQAGWVQICGWTPGQSGSGGWPPDDEIVAVELSDAQWRLTCSALERWAITSDRVGQVDEATMQRSTRDLVLAQIHESAPDWPGTL